MFRHLAATLFFVLVISIGIAQAATIYVPDATVVNTILWSDWAINLMVMIF